MINSEFTYTKLYEQLCFDGFKQPLLVEARIVTGMGFPLSNTLPMIIENPNNGSLQIRFVEDLTDTMLEMMKNPGSKPEYRTSLKGEFTITATGTGYSIRLTVPHTGGDGHVGDFEFSFPEALVEKSGLTFTLVNHRPKEELPPEIDWLKITRRAACQ